MADHAEATRTGTSRGRCAGRSWCPRWRRRAPARRRARTTNTVSPSTIRRSRSPSPVSAAVRARAGALADHRARSSGHGVMAGDRGGEPRSAASARRNSAGCAGRAAKPSTVQASMFSRLGGDDALGRPPGPRSAGRCGSGPGRAADRCCGRGSACRRCRAGSGRGRSAPGSASERSRSGRSRDSASRVCTTPSTNHAQAITATSSERRADHGHRAIIHGRPPRPARPGRRPPAAPAARRRARARPGSRPASASPSPAASGRRR